MKLRNCLLSLAFAGLLLAGCGGGGGASAPTLSKAGVLDLLTGGFARSAPIQGRTGPAAHEGESGVFFNEQYQLWVKPVDGIVSAPTEPSGYAYYIDHELTQPAGFDYVWISDASNPPTVIRDEEVITAGPMSGFFDKVKFTLFPDESGTMESSANYPGEGGHTATGSWNPSGAGTWTMTWTPANGTAEVYQFIRNEDMTETMILQKNGVTLTLNFALDGSGTGSITGNGEGLPASIVFGMDGLGTISWADGTTSPFDLYASGV